METMERLFAAINDRAEHFTTQDMSYLEGVLAALDEALEGKQALPIAQATKDDIRKAVQIAEIGRAHV